MIKKSIYILLFLSITVSCKNTNKTPKSNVMVKESPSIKNGESLIIAMHKRHNKNASKYITFDQRTIYYDTNTGKVTKREMWHEAISRPGKLHFRFGDFSTGNGFMYLDGHLFFIKENKITNEKFDRFNEWTVLCHDVYLQNPKKTIDIVKTKLKVNLNVLYETTWKGRSVYVVGAKKGDYKSNQFWIDKEHLYLVRNITLRDNGQYGDVRYIDYKKFGNEWIEGGLIVYYDKKLFLEEYYENTRTHKRLDDKLFDPKNFSSTSHFFDN